jgi:transposase
MRQKSVSAAGTPEKLVRDIRRATRKQYSAEEKIRIVLEGLRGEENISELCRREGIAASMYYGGRRSSWRPASAGWRATPPAPRRPAR